jgi:hypothetical protein
MKERPILFSGPMVRAILVGRKTQTRRAIKTQPFYCDFMPNPVFPKNDQERAEQSGLIWPNAKEEILARCPYGKVGDRLWIRETFAWSGYAADHQEVLWRADGDHSEDERGGARWRPSIHMPRWASRITLEITSVRVERLNEISEADAKAEGIERIVDNSPICGPDCWRDYSADGLIPFDADKPIASFRSLWESINGTGSWQANPWVWVIKFRRLEK